MEVIGFIFGLLGFIFAMGASARIRKLEQRLKEIGVLKDSCQSD